MNLDKLLRSHRLPRPHNVRSEIRGAEMAPEVEGLHKKARII